MRFLAPHVVIVVAATLWAHGVLPEGAFLAVFAGAHLWAPIRAARVARPGERTKAFLVGPGTIVGVHALLIVIIFVVILGAPPEDVWITQMLLVYWTIALAVYFVYCAIAFVVTPSRR
ncbi:MAG TPA: hypothetical protein VL463_28465 [Kofleriaceae bacterium]|jgi:hypothetical protein|nr:hypothetical protein [Kofleriaceae bacterium]